MAPCSFLTAVFKSSVKQECIPVGYVPPACCPYLPACPGQGGCLLPGLGGVCSREGVCYQGGCLLPGVIPACTKADPPCEQNDRQVQKYYLCPKLRLREVTSTITRGPQWVNIWSDITRQSRLFALL